MTRDAYHVLFLIADTGSGHRSAAEAISDALVRRSDEIVHCDIIDLFTAAEIPILKHAGAIYRTLVGKCEWLYNSGFRITNSTAFTKFASDLFINSCSQRFVDALRTRDPDLVVVIHPLLMSSLAHRIRLEGGFDYRLATVVVDLVSLHASWACSKIDLCMVSTDEAYHRMHALGIPAKRLRKVEFPVHTSYIGTGSTRESARRTLGINEHATTILVVGGGDGLGRLPQIVSALEQGLPGSQILAATGHNERASSRIRNMNRSARVYGFTNQMPLLMAAADAIVAKAGPSTIMAARAMRRPIIIFDEIGLQERGNGLFVEQQGLGVHCSNVKDLTLAVQRVLQNRGYGASETTSARGLKVTSGAQEIAAILLRELEEPETLVQSGNNPAGPSVTSRHV
jgi:1,2-diacylglycerol 3-beta-galactosyltransferase